VGIARAHGPDALTDRPQGEGTLASEGFHEPLDRLDEAALDYHRSMSSLCEELEAIDWYHQRVQATSDETLAAVLAYNRDDEKEHAAMALEWLRRRDTALDRQLRKFLFSSGPIPEVGESTEASSAPTTSGSLGIGSLKGVAQ
jgi:ferritin-like protein